MKVIPEHILKLMNKEDRPPGALGMTVDEISKVHSDKSEKQLRIQVENYLKLKEIIFCQARTDKKSTIMAGWPDLTFAIDGRATAFELKSETGKLTPEQESCHEKMKKNGWQIFVIREFNEAVRALTKPY